MPEPALSTSSVRTFGPYPTGDSDRISWAPYPAGTFPPGVWTAFTTVLMFIPR